MLKEKEVDKRNNKSKKCEHAMPLNCADWKDKSCAFRFSSFAFSLSQYYYKSTKPV